MPEARDLGVWSCQAGTVCTVCCRLRLMRSNDAAGVSRSAWTPLFGSLQLEEMNMSHPCQLFRDRVIYTSVTG